MYSAPALFLSLLCAGWQSSQYCPETRQHQYRQWNYKRRPCLSLPPPQPPLGEETSSQEEEIQLCLIPTDTHCTSNRAKPHPLLPLYFISSFPHVSHSYWRHCHSTTTRSEYTGTNCRESGPFYRRCGPETLSEEGHRGRDRPREDPQ